MMGADSVPFGLRTEISCCVHIRITCIRKTLSRTLFEAGGASQWRISTIRARQVLQNCISQKYSISALNSRPLDLRRFFRSKVLRGRSVAT